MSFIFGALYLIVAGLMGVAVYGMLGMFDFDIKKLWAHGWPIRVDFAVFIAVILSCTHGFIKLM